MKHPLRASSAFILDAEGNEVARLLDTALGDVEARAKDLVRLANLGARVLREACASHPPSTIVVLEPGDLTDPEVAGHLAGRTETPPVNGNGPASTEVICIGRGYDGCGYSGGRSGDTCPKCGGMLLSRKHIIVIADEAQRQFDAKFTSSISPR